MGRRRVEVPSKVFLSAHGVQLRCTPSTPREFRGLIKTGANIYCPPPPEDNRLAVCVERRRSIVARTIADIDALQTSQEPLRRVLAADMAMDLALEAQLLRQVAVQLFTQTGQWTRAARSLVKRLLVQLRFRALDHVMDLAEATIRQLLAVLYHADLPAMPAEARAKLYYIQCLGLELLLDINAAVAPSGLIGLHGLDDRDATVAAHASIFARRTAHVERTSCQVDVPVEIGSQTRLRSVTLPTETAAANPQFYPLIARVNHKSTILQDQLFVRAYRGLYIPN
jgi:hypothetical protein